MENIFEEKSEINVERLQEELHKYKMLYDYEKGKNRLVTFLSAVDDLIDREKFDLVFPILENLTDEEEP